MGTVPKQNRTPKEQAKYEYNIAWAKTHPDHVKRYRNKAQRKYRYGITPEEYNKILESQDKKCKICGSTNPGVKGTFYVDHNHRTHTVRGLLCNDCNSALGFVKESISTLQSMIEYLQ